MSRDKIRNDVRFLKSFMQDIGTVEREIPEVIESLEVIGKELAGMEDSVKTQIIEMRDDSGQIPVSKAREELANAKRLEEASDKVKNDLKSEINHVRSFIEHLKSLEQGAMQAENIIEESRKSV